ICDATNNLETNTKIYPLSLHDALPIAERDQQRNRRQREQDRADHRRAFTRGVRAVRAASSGWRAKRRNEAGIHPAGNMATRNRKSDDAAKLTRASNRNNC
ncbi:hypothetical protein, partial [Burkholderia sp. Ac-20392]|uniref:hypothetical protein n=1 Tax=Burkholderia sp. Ac-20392 TaxID=2703905 RepID=UPI00197E5366